MVGIKDFMRIKVKETIEECQKYGITVRMLSNQNRNTALSAAKEAGIIAENWV